MFKRYNGKRTDEADNQRMIRRKLISEDQVLVNDSEDDRSEMLADDEDQLDVNAAAVVAGASGPSYINVVVSWQCSQELFHKPIFN